MGNCRQGLEVEQLVFNSRDLSYYIISLGCSKNQVDSEKLNGLLLSAGFKQAEVSEEADLIFINTCGFIESAKKESIETIFENLSLKEIPLENNPEFKRKVVALGCLSQRYKAELETDIPEVDLVYGLADEKIIKTLSDKFSISVAEKYFCNQVPLVAGLSYQYIKIADGCSNNCSYCAIPIIRGLQVPSSPADIKQDVDKALSNGVRELIVVAQDTAAYNYQGITIRQLINDISTDERIGWIRILYSHPDHINDDFIKLFEENDKVVKYLDIPFQHVSKRIVHSMGRKGCYATYLELVNALRKRLPGVCLRSTFMVGYPGETEEEFEELVCFLKEAELDRVGVFSYSPEENTRAATMENQISADIKADREQTLMLVQQDISVKRLKRLVGEELTVLVEGKMSPKQWHGRSQYDAPDVDGIFYLTGSKIEINQFVKARVESATEYDLIGKKL